MTKKRKILIGIESGRGAADAALLAWERAQKGLPPNLPINQLYFEDMATLIKYLSPCRIDLLQKLRMIGPTNIRKLAQSLKRDYKNVYMDISQLIQIGLIEETKDKRFIVPWDEILAKLPLLSKAV